MLSSMVSPIPQFSPYGLAPHGDAFRRLKTMAGRDTVSALLAWCAAHGVRIDRRIAVVDRGRVQYSVRERARDASSRLLVDTGRVAQEDRGKAV